ncbi:MAG TPA: M28 family metallopeptidase [Longimicrobium sp.]|nr:M28 family metallopeptidase [Longimicrobium sp.]
MTSAFRPLATAAAACLLATAAAGQNASTGAGAPPAEDPRLREIAAATQPGRIEADIRRLAGFGTRHTLSDTLSRTRGIGAARRWLFDEFTRISRDCGGCLEVRYVDEIVPGSTAQGSRIPRDTRVVNVVAIQRGRTAPNRFVIVQGHYDSRVTDVMDSTSDAPGANDDASGVAVALESARVLSKLQFDGSVAYAALAGEEQGLNGSEIFARFARAQGWEIEGVLNNDIVGDSRGMNGVADNTRARVFGPGIAANAPAAELRRYLYSGGELDTPSRELMRYMDAMASRYVPSLDVMMVYRLDRFGRGGDHTPFFNAGYPAIRVTSFYEDYTRQHQNLRTENGIRYGDTPDQVDYPYVAKMAAMNAATLASLAWAPPAPDSVTIAGAVTPNTVLRWKAVSAPGLAGYRVYWREPESAQWQFSRFFPGNVTQATLPGIVIDNYFFALAAVDREGHESRAVYPAPGR